MEIVNRILVCYINEDATFFRKARALFLYNTLMILLFLTLIGIYAVANPSGFIRGATGAGTMLFFVLLSTAALVKGYYRAAVNIYLIPTVVLAFIIRFITAHTAPDTAFTTYIFYWLYLIVFAAVFGKKRIVVPLTLIFVASNIAVYLMIKPLLAPSMVQTAVTGMTNSTIALFIVGVVCFINIILSDHSYSIQQNKADENETQLKLIKKIFSMIQDIAASLGESSRRFTETAQSLSDGTQSQAAILEESSASMTGIADAIKNVSDDAKNQANALNSVESGISQLNTLIQSVSQKAQIVRGSSSEAIKRGIEAAEISANALGRMEKINGSTVKIKEITRLISDIADKTNLLALNASIESARAGAAGRGFAVVADEISKLADNSTISAKEISLLISETAENISSGYEMFGRLNTLIQEINATLAESHQGSSQNSETAAKQTALSDNILLEIRSVNALSQKIAQLMEQQKIATAELSSSFEGISIITQGTAASSEEVSGATELLAHDISRLIEIVYDKKES